MSRDAKLKEEDGDGKAVTTTQAGRECIIIIRDDSSDEDDCDLSTVKPLPEVRKRKRGEERDQDDESPDGDGGEGDVNSSSDDDDDVGEHPPEGGLAKRKRMRCEDDPYDSHCCEIVSSNDADDLCCTKFLGKDGLKCAECSNWVCMLHYRHSPLKCCKRLLCIRCVVECTAPCYDCETVLCSRFLSPTDCCETLYCDRCWESDVGVRGDCCAACKGGKPLVFSSILV